MGFDDTAIVQVMSLRYFLIFEQFGKSLCRIYRFIDFDAELLLRSENRPGSSCQA